MPERLANLTAVCGTPGAGRTSIAANLAVLSAKRRERVLLVDLDLRNPGIRIALGLATDSAGVSASLRLVAQGRLDEQRLGKVALAVQGTRERLRVLTGVVASIAPSQIVADRIGVLLRFAADKFDRVILDTSPFATFETDEDFVRDAVLDLSSTAVVVGGQEPAAIQRLMSAVARLGERQPPSLITVLNRTRSGLHSLAEVNQTLQTMAGYRIDLEVPEDRLLFDRASAEGRPALLLSRRGQIRSAYQNLLAQVHAAGGG